jgi:tRNA-specific 2-thiouridylase
MAKVVGAMSPKESPRLSTGQAGGVRKKKRVVIAISGGIDSSVAAALLKRAGGDELRSSSRFAKARVFDVIGVFMKFWSEPNKDGIIESRNRCCSSEAEIRARKVAKILKIPFYVLKLEKEFKKRIVDYFLKEHRVGRTPNPCVICNKKIKFGLLLEKALKLDADFVATGHYARKNELTTNNLQPTTYKLLRAKDKNKDQSYFLWMLNQNQLKRILFPIGNYTRKEVEKLAQKLKLPTVGAPKSQEICFVKTTINNFLKKYLKEKPGRIVDIQGKIIGGHRGLWFYTIGQRKGINIPGGPYWVLDKDLRKNLLIVTKNEKDLCKKELICKDINWISGKEPKLPLKIKTKIRYRHEPASAIITKTLEPKIYTLKFKKSQRAVTPGQSVVFYKGRELLGGGVIIK